MTRDKLIGYTVVQEFGAPYWTADLRFEGSSILEDDPNLEGYYLLKQTDTTTEEERLIFAGFPIKLSWSIKKGIIQYTARAVSNGWYLTQQNVPKGASASEVVHFNTSGTEGDYTVHKYARKNEEMLIWDYLFNNAPTDPERASYCSASHTLSNTSNLSSQMASATMTDIPEGNQDDLCGMFASDEMIANRSWVATTDWDPPDCKGNYGSGSAYWGGEDRRSWTFDYKTTTKYNAITKISSYCDRVFHFHIDEATGDNYAHWTSEADANGNGAEPFSVMLEINMATDDSIIDLKKQEQYTERAKPNCIYTYSLGATTYWDRQGVEYEGNHPAEWYELSSGSKYGEARRPVIHQKQVEDLTDGQTQSYAEKYYERIHGEEGNRYTASMVSTITDRSSPYNMLAPGSRIKISGIDANLIDPNTEYRIMKIVHRKDGGKPAMTTIEFSKVYDITHPYKISTSALDDILTDQVEKMGVGTLDDTGLGNHLGHTEADSLGANVFMEPCLIMNISDGLAKVQILNSTLILDNVIHLR